MLCHSNKKRYLTAEQLKIQQNAAYGINECIPKSQLSKVVKGLCAFRAKGMPFAVLDKLLAVLDTKQYPVRVGERAVCFIANQTLAETLGCCETTIQRAINKLAKLGIVTFKDSGNCKRFVKHKTGELFGIDFTPAYNNFADLQAQLFKLQAAKAKVMEQQAAIKTTRKTQLRWIDTELEAARKSGDDLKVKTLERLRELVEKINQSGMDYKQRLEALDMVQIELNQLCGTNTSKNNSVPAQMRCSTGVDAVYQYNTTLISFNKFGPIELVFETESVSKAISFENEKTDKKDIATCQSRIADFESCKSSRRIQAIVSEAAEAGRDSNDVFELDLSFVRAALSETLQGFGFYWNTWADVSRSVCALKRGLGFSDDALEDALSDWSPEYVALCLALALEKHLRGGRVKNPAGYARWLLRQNRTAFETLIPEFLQLTELEQGGH